MSPVNKKVLERLLMNRLGLLFNFLLLAIALPSTAIAQTLPLEDGAYLRNPKWCPLYFYNELDFIDFEVEQSGRSFGFPEVGCHVYSIKKVRDTRYVVEADCSEIGETYQRTMFLDVYEDNSVRFDGGELHYQCGSSADYPKMTPQQLTAMRYEMLGIAPPKPPQNHKSTDDLIELWHESNETCRGGSSSNPNTEKACDQRHDLTVKLNNSGWCFGRQDQTNSQYNWHECEENSIR